MSLFNTDYNNVSSSSSLLSRCRSVEPSRANRSGSSERFRTRAFSVGPAYRPSTRLLHHPTSYAYNDMTSSTYSNRPARPRSVLGGVTPPSYFDRYSELAVPRTPKFIDGYYKHFRQYYWYHTAPRTVSYFTPFTDWRYTSTRTAPATQNKYGMSDDRWNPWNLHSALSRVKNMQWCSRDLNYLRSMRDLKSRSALYDFTNRFDRPWPNTSAIRANDHHQYYNSLRG